MLNTEYLGCEFSLILYFIHFFLSEKLRQIEKKTGYPKAYFFLLGCVTLGLMLFVLGGAKLITDLVSFVYPAYMSFKAIDSGNADDDTQWLTYWVVFSFISIIESCATFLVEFIPFYFAIKVSFFVWLYHPKFKGAGLVYSQVIKPFVVPYLGTLSSTHAQKKVQ
jgi:receptor expression-enhancing protein 5/6